jgi:hypothetical protein
MTHELEAMHAGSNIMAQQVKAKKPRTEKQLAHLANMRARSFPCLNVNEQQ